MYTIIMMFVFSLLPKGTHKTLYHSPKIYIYVYINKYLYLSLTSKIG